MMKKTRSDARWNGLSAEQRQTLEKWLFDERMNYEEATRKAQAELGYKGSVSSVKRFYARRSQERIVEGFTEVQDEAQTIVDAPANAALLRTAAMKVVGQLFLRQVRDMPGNVKEWSALAKLMLWSEDIELRRQLKTEENQLRREGLAFAKERFEFDTVENALKILPQLQELAEARKDPKQNNYDEAKKINKIMLNLFGSELISRDRLHPENEEEEAAKEERERREREQDARRTEEHRREMQARREALGKNRETSNTEHPTSNIELGKRESKARVSPAFVPAREARGDGDDCAPGSNERIKKISVDGTIPSAT